MMSLHVVLECLDVFRSSSGKFKLTCLTNFWLQNKAAHLIKSQNVRPQVLRFRAEAEKEVELLKTSFTERLRSLSELLTGVRRSYFWTLWSSRVTRIPVFLLYFSPAASPPFSLIRLQQRGIRLQDLYHQDEDGRNWSTVGLLPVVPGCPRQRQAKVRSVCRRCETRRETLKKKMFLSLHSLQLVARKPSSSGAHTQDLGVGRFVSLAHLLAMISCHQHFYPALV